MLRQLIARRFRSLEPLDWEVEPGCHLLLGGTGAGKTSVLEAVYTVVTTRSFRTTQLADCARRDGAEDAGEVRVEPGSGGGFFLAAEVGNETRARLELAWSGQRGLERRSSGERVSLVRHLGAQPVLVWTSAEVEMLLGAPVARRRFLDRGVIHRRPSALETFATYRSLLAQKRSLLRAGGSRREVASWNVLLAEAAASIAAQRAAFADLLREAFAVAVRGSGLPFADLSIGYRPSPAVVGAGAAALLEALDGVMAQELAARRPLLGPHRDRLVLSWRGAELAQRASAGERKAIGLLLLSAQASVIERERGPAVLLIDDADAELDRPTLGALLTVLSGHPQVVLSSNRPEVFEGLGAGRRWRLDAGRMSGCK